MKKKDPKKVWIGPIEIAGYYNNLSQGFKAIGIHHDYATFTPHPFKYGEEKNENKDVLLKIIKQLTHKRVEKPCLPIMVKLLLAGAAEFFKIIYFVKCLLHYDVFIFGFGHSLLTANMDIPILRIAGKTVIMNLGHGSEVRPSYMDGAAQSPDGLVQPDAYGLYCRALASKRKIRFIEKHANYIIGAPFSSTQFASQKMLNWFSIGIPYGMQPFVPVDDQNRGVDSDGFLDKKCLRILHSPSHPAAKGSAIIASAINNLRLKGYSIEFIELRNRPNSEVLEEIKSCDFVVDQIYSDTPMAGFATEAAWYGKPAVVGGYGFEYLKEKLSAEMYPPSHTCHPDEIEDAIEFLINHPDYRQMLGKQAQAFVTSHWTVQKVAERYFCLMEGRVPATWWIDPLKVFYLHGGGQSEKQTKDNIRKMVRAFGVSSLQLSHRPYLEKEALKFAGMEP
ncbi:hypothetical protein OOT00_14885 [Desulfobotulus sp. H1]|uniref:Glycosyltransferase family 1 protein n=1 Tax=Desulfobotulus pelophilus TaxID=2823377 RepID=A0ABT3NCR9_9BACT|nr:hypothetical protein [Desulfobotulus pelophilus]MCW7755270.1 hypothetical protein [Desulfobotulus pelophilus]